MHTAEGRLATSDVARLQSGVVSRNPRRSPSRRRSGRRHRSSTSPRNVHMRRCSSAAVLVLTIAHCALNSRYRCASFVRHCPVVPCRFSPSIPSSPPYCISDQTSRLVCHVSG